MKEYDYRISTFNIITAPQGKFEVTIDSETVHSKLETDRFPSNEEIIEAIKARLPEEATPYLFRV